MAMILLRAPKLRPMGKAGVATRILLPSVEPRMITDTTDSPHKVNEMIIS